MTPTEFREWRHRLGLTQKEAAAVLGRSHDWVYRVEAGKLHIERVIELACWAIDYMHNAAPVAQRIEQLPSKQ